MGHRPRRPSLAWLGDLRFLREAFSRKAIDVDATLSQRDEPVVSIQHLELDVAQDGLRMKETKRRVRHWYAHRTSYRRAMRTGLGEAGERSLGS
jgi:hypothetical protein